MDGPKHLMFVSSGFEKLEKCINFKSLTLSPEILLFICRLSLKVTSKIRFWLETLALEKAITGCLSEVLLQNNQTAK